MHRPTDHQCLAAARRRLADHLSLHVTDRSGLSRFRVARALEAARCDCPDRMTDDSADRSAAGAD